MKNTFKLFLGIVAVLIVVKSFFTWNAPTILTVEVNIWLYRVFWMGISVLLLKNHFQPVNDKNK